MSKYDFTFDPPAPVIDVEVVNRLTGEVAQLRGQIDTGSSISAIPHSTVQAMGLTPGTFMDVRDFERTVRRVPIFVVTLRMYSVILINAETVGIERDDMLIGRDILEYFILTLDGKRREFTMVDS